MRTDLQNMIIGNLSTQRALINNLEELEKERNEWIGKCDSVSTLLAETKKDLDSALIECRKHRTNVNFYMTHCRTKDSVILELKKDIARLERRLKKKH